MKVKQVIKKIESKMSHRSLSTPFPHQVKLVVVGDGTVGKTCLLTVFVDKKFPTDYEPTIFNNLQYKIMIDGMVRYLLNFFTLYFLGYYLYRGNAEEYLIMPSPYYVGN